MINFPDTKNEKGYVIPVILIVLLLLSVFSATMLKRGFYELKKSQNHFHGKKAQITAYSSIELAKADIKSRVDESRKDFSFLLDGSQTDLNPVTSEKPEIPYLNGELNGLSYQTYISNNSFDTVRGFFSEDKDKIISIKGIIKDQKRIVYKIVSVMMLEESGNVLLVSVYRTE